MSTKLRYLYRAYRYRYRVDRAELRYVRDSLRPGQVAVDVGCHKGAYTYWMRRQVGPAGAVFAFEPQPRQVVYLRQAFATLAFDNVVLVPMALSDSAGRMPLHIPPGAGMSHAATLENRCPVGWASPTNLSARSASPNNAFVRSTSPTNSSPHMVVGNAHPTACSTVQVDVTTLDAFFADQPRGPDFLKIDVEGHELAVLHGGRNTLEKYRPTLLLECEARHRPDSDVRPVFDLLNSLGYQGTFFQNGRRHPLSEFDSAIHQRVGSNSDDLPGCYVNNFAFVPFT
jgi:FkbM family methyltransferase